MQFYIMWANHDVRHNYWNYHRYGDDVSILWDAKVDWDNFKIIVERVINQYLNNPITLKSKANPFSIFSIHKLMESFGGDTQKQAKHSITSREEVKKAGFPGCIIQWNQGRLHHVGRAATHL